MILGPWILIVATHVNAGAAVAMHEFADQTACERGAYAARAVAKDSGAAFGSSAHTWCVPKGSDTQ